MSSSETEFSQLSGIIEALQRELAEIEFDFLRSEFERRKVGDRVVELLHSRNRKVEQLNEILIRNRARLSEAKEPSGKQDDLEELEDILKTAQTMREKEPSLGAGLSIGDSVRSLAREIRLRRRRNEASDDKAERIIEASEGQSRLSGDHPGGVADGEAADRQDPEAEIREKAFFDPEGSRSSLGQPVRKDTSNSFTTKPAEVFYTSEQREFFQNHFPAKRTFATQDLPLFKFPSRNLKPAETFQTSEPPIAIQQPSQSSLAVTEPLTMISQMKGRDRARETINHFSERGKNHRLLRLISLPAFLYSATGLEKSFSIQPAMFKTNRGGSTPSLATQDIEKIARFDRGWNPHSTDNLAMPPQSEKASKPSKKEIAIDLEASEVSVLNPNDSLVINDLRPRAAEGVVVQDLKHLRVSAEIDFRSSEFVKDDPEVALKVIASLSEKLAEQNELIESLKAQLRARIEECEALKLNPPGLDASKGERLGIEGKHPKPGPSRFSFERPSGAQPLHIESHLIEEGSLEDESKEEVEGSDPGLGSEGIRSEDDRVHRKKAEEGLSELDQLASALREAEVRIKGLLSDNEALKQKASQSEIQGFELRSLRSQFEALQQSKLFASGELDPPQATLLLRRMMKENEELAQKLCELQATYREALIDKEVCETRARTRLRLVREHLEATAAPRGLRPDEKLLNLLCSNLSG